MPAVIWSVLACNTMHPDIPQDAGTLNEESLPDVYLAASPDTFVGIYTLARKVFGDDLTPCPTANEDEAGVYYEGQGCTDKWGATWHGSMNRLDREGIAEFNDFGPEFDDWRGASNYRLDGTVEWTYPDLQDTNDVKIVTDIVLTWEDDGTLVYVGGTGRALASGPILRDRSGAIGVGDWGTAEVEHTELFTAGARGCNQAVDGLVNLHAANKGSVDLPKETCALDTTTGGKPADCALWTIGDDEGELCIGDRMVLSPTDADPPAN